MGHNGNKYVQRGIWWGMKRVVQTGSISVFQCSLDNKKHDLSHFIFDWTDSSANIRPSYSILVAGHVSSQFNLQGAVFHSSNLQKKDETNRWKWQKQRKASECHPLIQWNSKRGEGFSDSTIAVQAYLCISIPNDLFESQPTASWCKAWTENRETNKPSQVCTAARWEKSSIAS